MTIEGPTPGNPAAAVVDQQTAGWGVFVVAMVANVTTNFQDLTITGGTASNGMDFIRLTNEITFAAGTDTVVVVLTPFLDHPIEGDETFTFTIVSNLAYTVGTASATVTIHDSPYGVWSIQHFTLEELTDPTVSGEAADFDLNGDAAPNGRFNFRAVMK